MGTFLNISIFTLAQVFMLVGLLGLFVPAFPGLLVMWLTALGYGIAKGFNTLAIILFILLTLLMIAGELMDNLLMGALARKNGASWISIGIGLVFGLLGTLLLPPLGGLVAAPLSMLLFEYQRMHDWKKAWGVVRGLATGWGLSLLARFGIGILIMGIWWIWVWKS